jgi:protease IV
VAQPTTITGSIGIFGMFYNVEGLMKNKLGITTDHVNTNAHSDFPSATHTLSPFEFNILQNGVNEGYETFTTKAAQGRRMSVEKLKTLASGRVWTGEQAKANGLVDKLGTLNDAITMAAKKAKLKDYEVRYVPNQKTFWEDIFNKGSEEAQTKIMQAQFGEMTPYIKQLQKLKKMEGIQARMMFDAEIK